MIFAYYLALSYIATSLLASGVHHGTRLARFSSIVRSHRMIPAGLATPLAILVTVFELAAGGAALAVLWKETSVPAPLLFSICILIGLAFALYVRQLLRSPKGITSCGCSAFASPLTIASIVPALALMLVSLIGLATTAFGFASPLHPYFLVVLPLAWGATLALIINLLPASMPGPAT
jgi:hypothetical protein